MGNKGKCLTRKGRRARRKWMPKGLERQLCTNWNLQKIILNKHLECYIFFGRHGNIVSLTLFGSQPFRWRLMYIT
ncbi:hypothetical protein OX90_28860, partial [Pseudomonas coronafaciens pv. porri]